MEILSIKGSREVEELIANSGGIAGICTKGVADTTCLSEQDRTTYTKRANFCLNNGHHSIFEHNLITFNFGDISKIMCMYLNSMGMYSTTERSGRYVNSTSEDETSYTKWCLKIRNYLEENHSKLGKKIEVIARENARYMLSLFDKTSIVYSVNLRQLNYLFGYLESYIEDETKASKFDIKLKSEFMEFLDLLSEFNIPSLRDWKRNSVFDKDVEVDVDSVQCLSEVYEARYKSSMVYLAQAQRHRTTNYRFKLTEDYYIPPIIEEMGCVEEWIDDLTQVNYPQGLLANIEECGTLDNLRLKLDERLCGDAQYEIMERSKWLAKSLSSKTDKLSKFISKDNRVLARCVAGYRCKTGCVFGGKYGVDRTL